MMKPFNQLRVIELATVLAGPAVGQFFAELGAEVWKIEPPGGDVTRGWRIGGEAADSDPSTYFACANLGKRSVCLDLRDETAREQLFHALETADVLLTNYRPGAEARLGLDSAALTARFPRLIQGAITGYGSASDRAGYDAVVQAESGFMHLNREPDGQPLKMPVALIDLLAAHQLKQGLLWALYQRGLDGKGRRVEVSLIEAAVSALANQATAWLLAGNEPQPLGSEHPNLYPYGALFATADGAQIMLAVGSDRQFAQLCERLGVAELAADPRFAANTGRVRHRDELRPLLSAALQVQDADDLLAWCRQRAVPAGRVLRVSEAIAQAEARGLLATGGLRTAAFLPEADRISLKPPPRLDEHKLEWLSSLNFGNRPK